MIIKNIAKFYLIRLPMRPKISDFIILHSHAKMAITYHMGRYNQQANLTFSSNKTELTKILNFIC